MHTTAQANTTLDSKGKSLAKPDMWCRVKRFVSVPYVSVAILAFVAVASSAVWFAIGGSWWFPVCVAVSAVSMILVCSCVYKCWIQRKAVHQSFCFKK
jgi:hypothetical protein